MNRDQPNLTPDELRVARDVLRSPQARPFLEADEKRKLEQRRALVAKLGAAGLSAKEAETLQAGIAAAEARVASAEAELRAAKVAHLAAHHALLQASSPGEFTRRRLERELADGADPRLEQFISEMSHLWHERTRDVIVVQPWHEKHFLGARTVTYLSNFDDVTTLRQLLRDAMSDAKAMQLEALSRAEVTARLGIWCERMRKPLQDLGIVPPQVTDAGVFSEPQPPAAA
jgi:hypothetical protein